MKNILFLFLGLVFFFTLSACDGKSTDQKEPTPIAEDKKEDPPKPKCTATKADFMAIDKMVAALYDLSPFDDEYEQIDSMNLAIETALKKLLKCQLGEGLNLNESLEYLYFSNSEDGLIRNFNWYVNNGGTWQEFRHLYQFVKDDQSVGATEARVFGGCNRFFKLEENKYLGFGIEKTCSTCMTEYANLLTITPDSLRIDEVIGFEYRMINMLNFDLDRSSKTLHFTMVIDDLNEDLKNDYTTYSIKDIDLDLDNDEEEFDFDAGAEVIVDSLVFNGERFVRK